MKNVLEQLEPKKVFHFFEEMTRIPHGSGNTAAATAWAMEFAQARGLRCRRDEMGNVVIWKEASPGYEDHPTVMLQGPPGHGLRPGQRGEPRLHQGPPWTSTWRTAISRPGAPPWAATTASRWPWPWRCWMTTASPTAPWRRCSPWTREVGMPGAAALDGSDLKSKLPAEHRLGGGGAF